MFNKAMTRKQLDTFLANQKPSIVAVEACGGAQYWVRKVQKLGHIAKILPLRQVAAIRQGQKTDVSDALAIAITARQPGLKTSGIKTLDQQSLQSDKRVQEHLSDQLTATGNMLRGLVAKFGVTIRKGKSAPQKKPAVNPGRCRKWVAPGYACEPLFSMAALANTRRIIKEERNYP